MSINDAPPPPGGAHSVGGDDNPRRKRPLWLWIVLAVIVIAALLLLLSRCGGNDNKSATATNTAASSTDTTTASSSSADTTDATTSTDTATPTAADTSVTAPTVSPTAAVTSPAGGGAGGPGSLTAGRTALLPLTTSAGPNGDLSGYVGRQVIAKDVLVQSAPANNGFWIGTSAADQVWVQLLQPGLVSPHPVRKGDHVSFTATLVTNPPGFADTAMITPATGSALLTAQKAHIQLAKSAVVFTN